MERRQDTLVTEQVEPHDAGLKRVGDPTCASDLYTWAAAKPLDTSPTTRVC